MDTTARLVAFAVGLIAAFGAAFGLGRTVGPVDEPDRHQPQPAPTTTHQGGHR